MATTSDHRAAATVDGQEASPITNSVIKCGEDLALRIERIHKPLLVSQVKSIQFLRDALMTDVSKIIETCATRIIRYKDNGRAKDDDELESPLDIELYMSHIQSKMLYSINERVFHHSKEHIHSLGAYVAHMSSSLLEIMNPPHCDLLRGCVDYACERLAMYTTLLTDQDGDVWRDRLGVILRRPRDDHICSAYVKSLQQTMTERFERHNKIESTYKALCAPIRKPRLLRMVSHEDIVATTIKDHHRRGKRFYSPALIEQQQPRKCKRRLFDHRNPESGRSTNKDSVVVASDDESDNAATETDSTRSRNKAKRLSIRSSVLAVSPIQPPNATNETTQQTPPPDDPPTTAEPEELNFTIEEADGDLRLDDE